MNKLFTLLLFTFCTIIALSQSLIVGIPSADVAEKNNLEFTHETQWNTFTKPNGWNSFNFFCFGLGNGLELTSTLNNINNVGSTNAAIGFGAKKVFNLGASKDIWEKKLVVGNNFLFNTSSNKKGIWAYSLYSFRVPSTKTRFTGGFSYGNSQTFGFTTKIQNNLTVVSENNKFVFLGGIEQPLFKNVSFVCDWYSGKHELGAFIPAMQYDFGHNIFIVGYKHPNNNLKMDRAIIIEFMINLPTKKKR